MKNFLIHLEELTSLNYQEDYSFTIDSIIYSIRGGHTNSLDELDTLISEMMEDEEYNKDALRVCQKALAISR